MKPDKNFCELMLSSSCFGREACPTPPCACAQSLIDRCAALFLERLQDHYWDSLVPHKDLILKHVRGALGATYKAANGEDLPVGAAGTTIINDGRPT